MAKTIKCNKYDLLHVLNATDAVPSAKLASDVGKHLGFRKALKKHLKPFLDKRADVLADFQKEDKKILDKIKAVDDKISTAKEEDKPSLIPEKAKLTKQREDQIDKVNKEVADEGETMKTTKVEVKFDNEDFLFEKTVIETNATEIFKKRDDTFDSDLAELVLDLLNNAE